MFLELADMASKLESLENIVLDIYTLKEGIYYKFDAEGKFKDYLIVNKDTPTNSELYLWFKIRDYYSGLLEINKPVDTKKKIHSNNMYSIFIKGQNLPGVSDNKECDYNNLNKIINCYYDKLAEENDKKEKVLLEEAGIDEIDKGKLNHFKGIMPEVIKVSIEHIKSLDKDIEFEPNKNYVKIFIQSDDDNNIDISNYIQENNRYIFRKIFNNNDYNIEVDKKIYGLSNENINLNSDKIFLKLKSTKFKVPYRVTLDEAILNHIIMKWIEYAKDDDGKAITRFYLPYDYSFSTKPNFNPNIEQGLYFETKLNSKGKNEIVESNVIPQSIKELKNTFKFIDYLDIDDKRVDTYRKRAELENIINTEFFDNKIQNAYYNSNYKPNGVSSYCAKAISIMGIPMKNYFQFGVENSLNSIIDKITLGIIINSVNNDINSNNYKDYLTKLTFKLAYKENLRLNLLKYFKIGGKENMGDILTDIIKKVKTKLKSDIYTPIESDEEYYFCVGQMTYYLCSLSEAKNKTQNMYNSILKAQNYEKINKIIIDMYIKYNHKVRINHKNFNKFMNMIKGYVPNTKNNIDMVICGLTVNNLLYDKNN
ncbi:MAG: hypothetical protein V8S74_04955 [Lachnospirales bacterium]